MKIVIPTFRRTTRQTTFQALSPSRQRDVVFVVREDEKDEMTRLFPGNEILVLPVEIDNLLDTRQWIWERFNDGFFIMADDDVKHFRHRSVDFSIKHGTVSNHIVTDEEQDPMFEALEEELTNGAGMAQPGPGWLMPDLQYWPRKRVGNCIQFVALNGPLLREKNVRWDRIKWVEDQDFVLQVLSHGLETVQLQDYIFYVPLLGVGDGGLNIGLTKKDRQRLELEALKELAKLWPGYVTPSKKKPGKHTIYRARVLKDARNKGNK